MTDQASVLRGLMARRSETLAAPQSASRARAAAIAVTSGKGGVGKTNIALNLAIALAQLDCRVCLVDANPGLGQVDLLCGLNGYWNLSHVATGARRLSDVVLAGPGGIHVVPGAAALQDVFESSPAQYGRLLDELSELEQTYDVILLDAGGSNQRIVRRLVRSCDTAMIITTAEPTSIADAYASVKALSGSDGPALQALVNQADTAEQADAVLNGLKRTAKLFLRIDVAAAGAIPRDREVSAAVGRREPFLLSSPRSPAAAAVEKLARRLRSQIEHHPPRGGYFARIHNAAPPRAA